MRNWLLIPIAALFFLPSLRVHAQNSDNNLGAVVKPTTEELRWRRIPWVLDLNQGMRLANEERRPIFLWVTGDDPLERC